MLVLSLVVASVVLGYAARDRVGGVYDAAWAGAYERLAPLFWQKKQFNAQEWRTTPVEGRYPFVRDLRQRLKGLSAAEVAELLSSNPDQTVANYPVRRADKGHLWYVLHLDYVEGRVADVSVRMAWLDP